MSRKNMTSEQRKDQIMRLFDAVQTGEVTAHDIARIINIEPSTYLRDILADLVKQGQLKSRVVKHRNHVSKRLYSLRRQNDAN